MQSLRETRWGVEAAYTELSQQMKSYLALINDTIERAKELCATEKDLESLLATEREARQRAEAACAALRSWIENEDPRAVCSECQASRDKCKHCYVIENMARRADLLSSSMLGVDLLESGQKMYALCELALTYIEDGAPKTAADRLRAALALGGRWFVKKPKEEGR